MKPLTVMVIAGEPSGDMLAAELVEALRAETTGRGHGTVFFGAGGEHMRRAGVELGFDLTKHSVIGLVEALKGLRKFQRLLNQLVCLALARRPDTIVCVDFSGFNRRFARALRSTLAMRIFRGNSWRPKIVQYVSPQVWASRPGRAVAMAKDYDLLLSILPFEKAWYAARVPEMRVEFVGHPLVDRHGSAERGTRNVEPERPEVLLLPGRRVGELRRHLPVLIEAGCRIAEKHPPVGFRIVVPDERLRRIVEDLGLPPNTTVQIGGLSAALRRATIAIASTGTVTLECAWFGVPTVAMYKTSWSTYQIGKRIVKVPFLAMPNILANEPVFPEFIQNAATAENLSRAALELLGDEARRTAIRARLSAVVATLGEPGAARRAAQAVLGLA